MKQFARISGFLFLVVALFTVGFAWRNIREGELPNSASLKAMVTGTVGNGVTADELFRITFNRIQSDYYRPVDSSKIKYAGLEGMVSSLGDPHTMFLPPVIAKEFDMDTRGDFEGVGARLQPDPLGAKLGAVFDDGPAFKAGLKAGDTIVEVDHKSTAGLTIDAIVTKIRGPKGTYVTLTILNPGSDKKKPVKIQRARVITPTVEQHVIDGTQIGYLTVSQFSETTTNQFDKALDRLEAKGPMKGLVIDLRGNPGGLLQVAVAMLSRFTDDNKVVVKMKFRDGQEEEARTIDGVKRKVDYPIAILIDEDSASAAEIFAGVMKKGTGYGLATLVGTHSYGKASVQNVFPLRDGSSAKITIARYFLPGGDDIGRKVDEDGQRLSGGLDPDVEAKIDVDDASVVRGDPKNDAQLAAAIDVLKKKSQ